MVALSLPGFHQRREHRSRDVLNVGFAPIECRDLFFGVDIDPSRETGGRELHGQRQAHVTEAHDANTYRTCANFFFQTQ